MTPGQPVGLRQLQTPGRRTAEDIRADGDPTPTFCPDGRHLQMY